MFGSLVRTAWPDGGSYLEQEQIVVEVFEIITDQRMQMAQRGAEG